MEPGKRGRLQANQWFSHNNSVTSLHTSVIFDIAAKLFGSLTERYVEISNFLMIRLLC